MNKVKLIFEKQWLHLLLLIILLIGMNITVNFSSVRAGHLWGISTSTWLWISVIIPIAHQVFVWFCWRTQLHMHLLTRIFGKQAFTLYAAGFSILGVSRVIIVFILAISNMRTLPVNRILLEILAVVVAIPAAYLFYSVKRYFGFKRAFGIDHFNSDYRSTPFIRNGIYKYTSNGQYIFGFLLLWIPALWFASSAALIVALFNHIYIWIHYYSTELPDIKRIYSKSGK